MICFKGHDLPTDGGVEVITLDEYNSISSADVSGKLCLR